MSRVVVITGGGTGIGAATARRFAGAGWKVVVAGRRRGPIEDIAAELGGVAVQLDAAEPEGAERLVAEAVEAFGGIDCAVLNAGISRSGSVVAQTPESWNEVLRVNLTGPFLVARAALPHLLERRGSIVAVSSEAAFTAGRDSAAYSTSKAALNMLVSTIAIDFADQGIRANAVCPAWVRTEMGDALMDELAAQRGLDREGAYAFANRLVPARRAATLEEVAGTIFFLASDEAAYINGAAIPVDGGARMVNVGLEWGTT
jgi:meso-butanediol dehydrogenase / (S,S)-butanediol dehydrogenase / diacetyl reductase